LKALPVADASQINFSSPDLRLWWFANDAIAFVSFVPFVSFVRTLACKFDTRNFMEDFSQSSQRTRRTQRVIRLIKNRTS
jgi:hypothetical protein